MLLAIIFIPCTIGFVGHGAIETDLEMTEMHLLSDEQLKYWIRFPGWRIREAAALLLLFNPDHEEYFNKNQSYIDLKRIMLRARSMHKLKSPDRPRNFLEWAKANDFDVPPKLISSSHAGNTIRDWKHEARRYRRLYRNSISSRSTLDEDFTNEAKSRGSLAYILHLIVCEKYLYRRDYSSAAANICSDANRRGLKNFPSSPVVSKWLGLAADEVQRQKEI